MIIDAFGLTAGATATSWHIDRCEFRPRLNLLVGASGAGKTKVLQSLFDLAHFAVSDVMMTGCSGFMEFTVDGAKYRWDLVVEQPGLPSTAIVKEEHLRVVGGPKIFERNGDQTTLNDRKMPKLPRTSSVLRTLREEESLAPIHKGFSSVRIRRFQGAELDNARALQSIPLSVVDQCKSGTPAVLYLHKLSLSSAAKLLKDHFPNEFRIAVQAFKQVFSAVEDVRIMDAHALDIGLVASAPVLAFKEKKIANAIPVMEWSSGMVKVLLLIFDVLTQPRPSIYMVDEYENSLGVNAIDFFPGFSREYGEQIQFFVTSHHPLLINAIPISDWIVLGRDGAQVHAMYGDRLKERYGLSHHEQYVQLLNDPFYQRGET